MKAVILAGGLGTRLSEETQLKPKPMIEIGGRPLLWHIMKMYHSHGVKEFIICCGYKGFSIKEYFSNYQLHMRDVTFDGRTGEVEFEDCIIEDWRVTIVDTGELSMTGTRLRNVQSFLNDDTSFCFTYGDGVSDVDIKQLIDFHHAHNSIATVTAVHPPSRFGVLGLNGTKVNDFMEKPLEQGWISGGFFVLNSQIFDYLIGDDPVFEQEPMQTLARNGELEAFTHEGYWQPMDTMREKVLLENMWQSGNAPWKCWE